FHLSGPAQVPMMSPNGSVPPIYVPPGYVSQIIEENGVRRVLVLPQAEFLPGSHSPLHPHLPAFIPHHAMMPPPPHHVYTTVSGAGDMTTQYIPQYHPSQVYGDQDSHSLHGRSGFVNRDDRTSKTYERLQRKLKDRHGGATKDKMNSPPSSPQKSDCSSPTDIQNGLGKGQNSPGAAPVKGKQVGKVKGSPRIDTETQELDEETKALQTLLSNISKPVGYGFKPKYNGDDLSCTVKNLRRSTKYRFRVAAYNSEGTSNPSEATEFCTCPDRPGAPYRPAVKGKVHANNFKMIWEPPKEDGGAPVTKYIVEMSEGSNGNKWEMVYSGSVLEHVCDQLSPGCAYQVRVYCISEGGQSPLSETLLIQTPAVPPGQCMPPRLVGKPKARELQMRWGAPQVDGGCLVSCYSLEMSPAQAEEHREVYMGPELECTVIGLLPGKTYSFRLRAANKAGYGPYSEKCEITTAPGVPHQCKPPHVACRSPTCAIVSWEAVNVAGAGLFSEVVLCVTPSSVPAAVSCLRVRDESEVDVPHYYPSTCLALQWEEPCDHGSEITSYSIDFGDRQPITVARTTNHIIENLQPDATYRIRIQALNSIGAGPFSHTIKLKTKPLPPEPPRLECTALSHQNLKLKWGESTAKSLQSDSIQYHLQMEDRSGRFVSLYRGPCHTHKVQRLNESTTYTFRIQAFNEAGEGPFSDVYTFTTPKSPPAPLKAPRIERLDDHTCEVTWEALQPMKGDPVIYSLQSMIGNSEFKQIYKGSARSFQVSGLQLNCEHRFRACAIRQCQNPEGPQDLIGPYSATVTFSSQKTELPSTTHKNTVEVSRTKRTLSDEQCAAVILVLFAIISILIAFVIQYFVIK
ncbi:UNVERIFIED_CONTAM: hypothetical protein FKN15_041313, partial [Acipenser sinensis]